MPEPPAADGAQPAPAPPATRVVLVRHAVTAETGPVLSGRRSGIDLSGLPVAAVYSSPLERCRQTAEAIAAPHGLSVTDLPGLAEADYGDWTGQKIEDLRGSDLWKLVQVAPSAVRLSQTITEDSAR